MKKSYSIIIKGQVQNVGFRYNTVQMARQLKVFGTIKNQEDGSVNIQIEGDEQNINKFIDWCKEGPPHAKVDETSIKETSYHGYINFAVEY